MRLKYKSPLIAGLAVMLLACEPSAPAESGVDARWYSPSQLSQGAQVFAANCASCHGDEAQGRVADWKSKLANGSFPPPPLDGSAHAWHHPLALLLQVVNEGGAELGGQMPAFAEVLSEADKLAAIAYFQGFWNDETYAQWQAMGGSN